MSDRLYDPISLDLQAEYRERLARCPQPASDYAFANLLGWAGHYGLEWSFGDRCVFIRQTKPQVIHWAPVGPWFDVDWRTCPRLTAGPAQFIRVPESLALHWREVFGPRLTLEESREHWDYVYLVEDLARLAGNRFIAKRNHVNQFRKRYVFEYRAIGAEDADQVLAMQDSWCRWSECEGSAALTAENTAIARVLLHWERLPGLRGGGLFVDGRMVAYTVADPLDAETLVIHFEKADTAVRGAYQAINQMFLEHAGAGFRYVNREQDLGEPGLRKAKLSYNPDRFLKKYALRLAA